MANEPFILTPIDNILPRYHVSKLLFFPSSNSVTTIETVDALRKGLEKSVQAFPLLGGTVQEIQPDSDHEQRGRLCVSGPWHTMSDIFSVQDLTDHEAFDYSSLRAERFPGYKLDAATLLPQDKESKPDHKSVMLAKVNKIRGGLIVVHSLSHGFMDGGGMAVSVADEVADAAPMHSGLRQECPRSGSSPKIFTIRFSFSRVRSLRSSRSCLQL